MIVRRIEHNQGVISSISPPSHLKWYYAFNVDAHIQFLQNFIHIKINSISLQPSFTTYTTIEI